MGQSLDALGTINSNQLKDMRWISFEKFGLDIGEGEYWFRFRIKKG
jgi:hypothetical protein